MRGRGTRADDSKKNSLSLANALPASPSAPRVAAVAPTYPESVLIVSSSPEATTPLAYEQTSSVSIRCTNVYTKYNEELN